MSSDPNKRLDAIEDAAQALMNSHGDLPATEVGLAVMIGLMKHMIHARGESLKRAESFLAYCAGRAPTEAQRGPRARRSSFYESYWAEEDARWRPYNGNDQRSGQANRAAGDFNYWRSQFRQAGMGAEFDAMFGAGRGEQARRPPPPPPPPPPPGDERSEPWHVTLGVPAHATKAAIRAAWKGKIRTAHPDAGGSTERAQRLNMAKEEGLRVARA